MGKDQNSLLSYFRELTEFRQKHKTLKTGKIVFHDVSPKFENKLFVYSRIGVGEEGSHQEFYIVQNFYDEEISIDSSDLLGLDSDQITLVFTTKNGIIDSASIPGFIPGFEGWILGLRL